jgi:hypothetical protein
MTYYMYEVHFGYQLRDNPKQLYAKTDIHAIQFAAKLYYPPYILAQGKREIDRRYR